MRVVWLAGALVVLAAVMTVLSVVLDEEIRRDFVGTSADSAIAAPTFTPVIITLDVVVTGQVLVLLAFLWGGHNWARHCLAVAFALLGVSTAAMLVSVPPWPFTMLGVAWLVLDVALLALLYRPGMARAVAPAEIPRGQVPAGS